MKWNRVVLPAIREIRFNRRPPRVEHTVFHTRSTDGVVLRCTVLGDNPRNAVVVAHPAIVGAYYHQVVTLAEEISRSFSTFIFDFRGHGGSTGRCQTGFEKASEDLEAVIDRVAEVGFGSIGVAGFSLGAAAGMLLAARRECFGSLVSIGCPPRFPESLPLDGHPLIARAALRVLGMRLDPEPDSGLSPLDVAATLPAIPKLMVFGEFEVAPPEEITAFYELVTCPKQMLKVPGAWHADLKGKEDEVREWFEETL